MIAKLTGTIDSLLTDGVVLDVGGVGYMVLCSGRTLGALPPVGETAVLLIETHVREDHIHLYGFSGAGERAWFRLLLTVQGIGARVALSILTALSMDELAQAVAAQDKATLTRANGVGNKVAQRVVAELKDKAGDLMLGPAALIAANGADVGVPAVSADAVSALVNLGYRPSEAAGAIAHAAHDLGGEATAEALIRAGLRELAAPAP